MNNYDKLNIERLFNLWYESLNNRDYLKAVTYLDEIYTFIIGIIQHILM